LELRDSDFLGGNLLIDARGTTSLLDEGVHTCTPWLVVAWCSGGVVHIPASL
jgi:hypothetical protein